LKSGASKDLRDGHGGTALDHLRRIKSISEKEKYDEVLQLLQARP
jgi:hypothetical protein